MPLPDSIENLAMQAGVSTADHFEDLTEGAEARLDEYVSDERRTMETLEAVVAELERRNRRSHAKTSRELSKARRLIDQYRLEQS